MRSPGKRSSSADLSRANGAAHSALRAPWANSTMARPAMEALARERPVEEIEPVLAPEALAVQHVGRRTEHAEPLGLVAVLLVERLHLRAALLLLQLGAGQ